MAQSKRVTAKEVAELFDVSIATVNRWVREGRIPCIRPSRKVVRFDLDEVERAVTTSVENERRRFC